MDHRFRGERRGLIKLGEIPERRSREEFQALIDPYADEAVTAIVPMNLRLTVANWARSFYTLKQHVQAIEAYDIQKLPEPTNVAWNQTKQHVLTQFRRFDKVQVMSYKDFNSVKWLRSSAAGYGYVGRKGENDNYHRAKKTAVTISEKLNHDDNYVIQAINESTPDVAFTRTQMSQIKVKTKVRNVWGEAFHYVLLEGLFAQPLIEYFKSSNHFYFIGEDPLLSVPHLIGETFKSFDYIYSLDWSAFDASVQEWELRFAFQCLLSMLEFPSRVESRIWHFVVELFIYRKIAGPNGVLYLKTQGIPSGSCFTNILGSIANYVRIQYMFKQLKDCFVQAYTHGDDSLVAVNSDQFVLPKLFVPLCEDHNWKINDVKSQVSARDKGITFLSRTVREGQNFREEEVCIRMLLYPEYRVPSGAISTVRARSIMLDSGIHSKYLFDIYKYLKDQFGEEDDLPDQFKIWNVAEYEARKEPYISL